MLETRWECGAGEGLSSFLMGGKDNETMQGKGITKIKSSMLTELKEWQLLLGKTCPLWQGTEVNNPTNKDLTEYG